MKKTNYTPELKETAVRLVLESEKDYPSTWAVITAIAPKTGIFRTQAEKNFCFHCRYLKHKSFM